MSETNSFRCKCYLGFSGDKCETGTHIAKTRKSTKVYSENILRLHAGSILEKRKNSKVIHGDIFIITVHSKITCMSR